MIECPYCQKPLPPKYGRWAIICAYCLMISVDGSETTEDLLKELKKVNILPWAVKEASK